MIQMEDLIAKFLQYSKKMNNNKYLNWKTKISLKYLLKGNFYYFLKYLLNEINYWRHVEFEYVYNKIDSKKNKILDISSAKSFAFFLSENNEVESIDIWEKEINRCKKAKKILNDKKINTNLNLQVVDARKLPYPDNYFDYIYSISVIEHIEDKGDTIAIKEMERVLKKGGKCILTMPYNFLGYNVFRKKDVYKNKFSKNKIFFERKYDLNTLRYRIIDQTKLKLTNLELYKEKIPFQENTRKLNNIIILNKILIIFRVLFGFINFKKIPLKKRNSIKDGIVCLTFKK
jgi:ubiquinone/menaquinone biosynthesis C-methylase UbiE